MKLPPDGFTTLKTEISQSLLSSLRESAFADDSAGQRCLLDNQRVREAAITIKHQLTELDHIPKESVAIQAIAFDKNPTANWQVSWHQDLMFPFAQRVTSPKFDLASQKAGIDYARPPVDVLNNLIAARLHLDVCDQSNGPLRISPSTHRFGILPVEDIGSYVEQHGSVTQTADIGEVLLFHPLALHSSSRAISPDHRRVLHIVFYTGLPIREKWHREINTVEQGATANP